MQDMDKGNKWDGIIFIFGMILISIIVTPLLASIVTGVLSKLFYAKYNEYVKILISNLIDICIYAYVLKRKEYVNSKNTHFVLFKKIGFRNWLSSFIVFLGVKGLMIIINSITPLIYSSTNVGTQAFNSSLDSIQMLIVFFSMAIFGPIREELMCRGLIQGELRRIMKPFSAIFLSSLVFGIAHFEPVRVIYITITGMAFGLVYEKFGALILPMVLHIFNNSIAGLTELNQVFMFDGAVLGNALNIICIILTIPAIVICVKWIREINNYSNV